MRRIHSLVLYFTLICRCECSEENLWETTEKTTGIWMKTKWIEGNEELVSHVCQTSLSLLFARVIVWAPGTGATKGRSWFMWHCARWSDSNFMLSEGSRWLARTSPTLPYLVAQQVCLKRPDTHAPAESSDIMNVEEKLRAWNSLDSQGKYVKVYERMNGW